MCTKPFLTLSEQVALLQNRGLLVCDETYAEVVLAQLILRFASIVEVSLRSHEAYIHAKNHGPLGYRDTGNFVNPDSRTAALIFLDKFYTRPKPTSKPHPKRLHRRRFFFCVPADRNA